MNIWCEKELHKDKHLVELVMVRHWKDDGVDFSEQLDVVRSHVPQVNPPKFGRHCETASLLRL